MSPSSDGREVDLKRITNAEYQLFLDEMRERRQNYRPDYWSSDRFLPGHGLEEVVGVRPGDAQAFCDWLTSRAQDGSRFELPNENEIEEPGHWSRSQNGLICKPLAGSGKLITPEQLRARFESDIRRSGKWKIGYHGNRGDIGTSEEKLFAPIEQSPFSVRQTAELAANIVEMLDSDKAFDLGSTVYRLIEENIEIERAWDPELIRSVAGVFRDFTLGDEKHSGLFGGLNLLRNVPRFLDLDAEFSGIVDDSAPWYHPTGQETEVQEYAFSFARALDDGIRAAWEDVLRPRTMLSSEDGADPAGVAERFRWALRLRTLLAAGFIYGDRDTGRDNSHALECYCALYDALAIFEERFCGTSPYEGIRIVRERLMRG